MIAAMAVEVFVQLYIVAFILSAIIAILTLRYAARHSKNRDLASGQFSDLLDDGGRRRRRLRWPDLSDPQIKFRATLYAGATAIFGLLFIAAVFPLASNPTFCGNACHNMKPEWESWKRSSHAEVTCYGCHVDRTLPALFVEKLTSGPKGMFNTVLNRYEKPINPHGHYSQTLLPMELVRIDCSLDGLGHWVRSSCRVGLIGYWTDCLAAQPCVRASHCFQELGGSTLGDAQPVPPKKYLVLTPSACPTKH